MRHFKLFSFILVLSILGVLPAFGYTITFSTGSGDGTSASTSTACSTIVSDGSSYLSGNLATATKIYYSGSGGLKMGTSSAAGVIKMNLASSVTPTSIVVSAKLYNSSKATTLKVNGSDTQSITADFSDLTFNITSEISYLQLESSKYCWIQSITVNTSGGSTPSLTLTPTSASVAATDVANQSITLTTSNFSSSISSVTTGLFSDAECNTAITSGAWVKDITVNSGKTAVTFNVDDNNGAQRQCWMKITATAGSQSASAILPITQAKYSAPTGTFKLYSGDISEGDYVIYYDGKAMNTTVTSNRLQYAEVTPSNNQILNPDESIIWHIAPFGGSYWTLYNAAEDKYAGGTSTKNQAAMLSSITTLATWTIAGSSTYEFENFGRSQASSDSGNKWLRNNGANGFACYASGTGGALTLYKLDDGTPSAPTFSPAGGSFLEAQSVTLSAEDGAEIYYTTDGTTTPTSSSTHYTGAIPVSSTTTIKAVAIKNDKSSSVASATYTITTPKSVDEIWDEITSSGPEDAYVYGYVSQTNVSGYENNFYISVDGSTESNQLYAYRMNMNSFSVAVGDKVTLNGDLTIFNNVKEFKYTNAENCGKIISVTPKGALQLVAVSGTPTKTVYSNGDAFEPAGLVVTATYANGYATAVAADSWECNPATVTASGNISVKATYESVQSSAYIVPVTVSAKTVSSISAGTASYTIYTGELLPEPTITATYSEGEPADVSAEATYDSENVFDTETLGQQTITVSYTFGANTVTTTYTVTVVDYANDVDHPYTVAEAINIITKAIGATASARNIYVRGIVSQKSNPSSNAQTYYISDDGTTTNQLEIYKGKYIGGANFTTANQVLVNDEVVVGGKVKLFNSTPEFDSNSEVQSLARTPNFSITDVTEFEVGAADLAVDDLTIAAEGEGAVTFASSSNTDAVTIVDGKLHAVAAGTAEITANLAANGIYKAATTTFSVTVIATQTKYAITFDGNGADGGTDPEAIADKAEGVSVTLPENSWTKTGYTFKEWTVFYIDGESVKHEVAISEGAFTMPASAVTIQAQWEEIPYWATVYTSNVTVGNDKVVISTDQYDAKKAGTGSAYGTTTVTIPSGTTKLHFHAAGWGADNVVTLTVENGQTTLGSFTLKKDAGVKSSSPYTLEGSPYEQYYSVELSDINESTDISFTATGGYRFVLYGVNAIYPEITLDPTSFNFGSIRANQTKQQEFTIVANENVKGTLSASLEGTDAAKFEVSAIADGKVTVTFNPNGAVGENFTAKLHVAATNASVDAELTATSIEATAPEITVNKTLVDFGRVEPNATVANELVSVELANIDENGVSVAITGSVFTITPANLTENGNVSISLNTADKGVYEETLTLSATGAESKEITVKATVASKWDITYTSNVELTTEGGTSATASKVRFSTTGTQYDAIKCGTGSVAGAMKLTLPAKTEKLHLHAAAWKGESVTINITIAETDLTSLSLTADEGVSSNSPYTLKNSPIAQAFDIEIPENPEKTTLTLTASGGNRFIVYGVNQEGGIIELTEDANVSSLASEVNVEVSNGVTLTVDEDKTLGDLTVENGGKVVVSNKKLTVKTFAIETTMGSGKSGQLTGVTSTNFEAQQEAYIDITLGANGTNQQWHAFTVPFPVDVLNGIYDLADNKLTNEVNYAIMEYFGDIRAEGKYGWKKIRTTLVPGTFYIMATDGYRTTYRFKKKAGAAIVAANSKEIKQYAKSGAGTDTDAGWNGVGNPTLTYGKVAYEVQVLDPESYTFVKKDANSTNFVVGTPFFYQAAADGSISMLTADAGAHYAPARTSANEIEKIKVAFGNEEYTDYLDISASEDATNEYQIGKDLVKMTMTNTPKVAQIFGVAYNTKLCMVNAPLHNDQAKYSLNLYAPADGEYTIAVPDCDNADIYLTYEGHIIWNIAAGPYTGDFKQGDNNGYGLVLRRKPQVTTGIENSGLLNDANGVQKIILNDHVYILKGEQLYDVTGKMVR